MTVNLYAARKKWTLEQVIVRLRHVCLAPSIAARRGRARHRFHPPERARRVQTSSHSDLWLRCNGSMPMTVQIVRIQSRGLIGSLRADSARRSPRVARSDPLIPATPDPPPVSRHADRLFARIRDVIKDGFADADFGAREVAAEAGISLRYLQKLFTARGISPSIRLPPGEEAAKNHEPKHRNSDSPQVYR
jgi:AraC-like DNA-binding protein